MRFLVPIIIGGIVLILGGKTGDISTAQSSAVLDGLRNLGVFAMLDYKLAMFVVRKLAHLGEYALFGLTANWSFDKYLSRKSRDAAFLLAFALATYDECRQLFTTGRVGCVQDVLIDILGAMLGMAIYNLFRRKHSS